MPVELGQNQNIERSRKQVQITLFNGRVVLMQEGKNSRILSTLNDANINYGTGVNSEVLIAPYTSLGIDREEVQQSLWNSVHYLNRVNLKGTGCIIDHERVRNGSRDAPGIFYIKTSTSETRNKYPTETVILTDYKTVIRLRPRETKMLQRIVSSGVMGMTLPELIQPHLDEGKDEKYSKSIVRNVLTSIKAALDPTPFEVENLTPNEDSLKGIGGRWIYRKRVQETIGIEDSPQAGDEEQEDLIDKALWEAGGNIVETLASGKLHILETDTDAYVRKFLPVGVTIADPNNFIHGSLTLALRYFENNTWDFRDLSPIQARIIETCISLRTRPHPHRYTPERAKKEILSYFNLL